LLGQRISRVSNFGRRRVGGGSAEFTSAEGGGACRPHQEGPRTQGLRAVRRSSTTRSNRGLTRSRGPIASISPRWCASRVWRPSPIEAERVPASPVFLVARGRPRRSRSAPAKD
jgi:hypothetical protein